MKNVEMKVILLEVHMHQSVKKQSSTIQAPFQNSESKFRNHDFSFLLPRFFFNDAYLKSHMVINHHVKFGCILSDF